MAGKSVGRRMEQPLQLLVVPLVQVELRDLEHAVAGSDQTQIFIETPYRNLAMLESIVKTCHPNLMLCIAADLTLETEWIRSLPIREWKNQKPDLHKRPAVFLLGN